MNWLFPKLLTCLSPFLEPEDRIGHKELSEAPEEVKGTWGVKTQLFVSCCSWEVPAFVFSSKTRINHRTHKQTLAHIQMHIHTCYMTYIPNDSLDRSLFPFCLTLVSYWIPWCITDYNHYVSFGTLVCVSVFLWPGLFQDSRIGTYSSLLRKHSTGVGLKVGGRLGEERVLI